MNLTIWESLFMGFVAGLTELLPVSAQAHKAFLCLCFGVNGEGALFSLLCHLSVLTVIALTLRPEITRLRRAASMMRGRARRRHQQPDYASAGTLRHLKGAMVLTALVRLVTCRLFRGSDGLLFLAAALAVGGAVLFLPDRLPGGNKDGRNMLPVDSLLMGAAAGLGAVPGLSTLGTAVSLGQCRAVDRGYALRFCLLLALPALGVEALTDVLEIIAAGSLPSLMGMLTALAGAALSALGAWIGLRIMTVRARGGGFAGWCYYLWGMAAVCFLLFLTL